jgi:hypothetical protein
LVAPPLRSSWANDSRRSKEEVLRLLGKLKARELRVVSSESVS